MSAIKPDGNLWIRARKKRVEKKITQIDLARKIEVPHTLLQKIESNIIKRPSCINDLARVLDTTPEWLMAGIGFSSKGTESFYKKIPILNSEEAIKWCNPQINDIVPDEKTFLYNPLETSSENNFAIKVTSPSMENEFPLNSVIILEPLELESEELNSGEFYLFYNSAKEKVFVRQYVLDNEKYMRTLNTHFPLEVINKNIKCIAKVICSLKILNSSQYV